MDNRLSPDRLPTLKEFLRIFRRQPWVIGVFVIVIPVTAILLSVSESALYEAKSDVLLNRQNPTSSLTGATDPSSYQDPQRFIETQAAIATAPELVRQVIRRERLGLSVSGFLDISNVAPKPNVDLLQFSVTDRDSAQAERLATDYAASFISFRRNLDTGALAKAKSDVAAKLAELTAAGSQDTGLYRSLLDKEQQLITLETLQSANAYLIHPAVSAERIRPRMKRAAAIGVFLGLALGLVFAFVRDAFDTRIRSAAEIEETLGIPLISQIPEPPRRLRQPGRLLMLAEPESIEAEAFRILRTNLELSNADTDARMIMVTSAVPGEGKTTTAANLAVAFALDGSRVTLVDLDLRRPSLAGVVGVKATHGLTDVVVGRIKLEAALVVVPMPMTSGSETVQDSNGKARRAASAALASGATPETKATTSQRPRPTGWAGFENDRGLLQVLSAGRTPPNVGEFVRSKRVAELLGVLRDRSDIVLVDVPPLLAVGDALNLSSSVDGVLVVAGLNLLDRRALTESKRVLDRMLVPKLGLVLTGTDPISDDRYGDYFTSGQSSREVSGPDPSARSLGRLGRSR